MAELSIKTIIDAGKKSLEDKNYWSALVVALTLPSMCSRIEYFDEKYKGSERNDEAGIWYEDKKGKHWHDRRAYVKWCKEWVSLGSRTAIGGRVVKNEFYKDDFLVGLLGEEYPDKLYEMRCNILHQCETDIEHGSGLPIFFSTGIGNTTMACEQIVEIVDICEELFRYAESWMEVGHMFDLPKRQYYDGNDRDDRLLHQKLCDESRAENLLKQHTKEIERRNKK